MNSGHLARHYQTLTPWERLPLMVAAAERGDVVEEERLSRSAPRNGFRIPDYWGLVDGLDSLAKVYLLEQLNLAAWYWRMNGLLDREPLRRPSRKERQRDERRWQLLQMLCYRFVVHADGWRLLCSQMHIDPEVLLKDLSGYESVKQMEESARLVAFSAEEALAFLRADAEGRRPAEEETAAVRRQDTINTADDVAQSMRAFLQRQLDEWR